MDSAASGARHCEHTIFEQLHSMHLRLRRARPLILAHSTGRLSLRRVRGTLDEISDGCRRTHTTRSIIPMVRPAVHFHGRKDALAVSLPASTSSRCCSTRTGGSPSLRRLCAVSLDMSPSAFARRTGTRHGLLCSSSCPWCLSSIRLVFLTTHSAGTLRVDARRFATARPSPSPPDA